MNKDLKIIISIIFFVALVLIIYEIGGSKSTVSFLTLVLIGTIFTHTDQIKALGNLYK